jgi:hypothetical protein
MARTRYTSFAGFEHREAVDRCTSDPWHFGDKVSLLCITIQNHIYLFSDLQSLGDQFARWTSMSRVIHQGPLPNAEYFVVDDVFKSTVHRAVNRCGVRRYSIPLFFGTDYNVKLEVNFGH